MGRESKCTGVSRDMMQLASFRPRLTQMSVCWDCHLIRLDSGEGCEEALEEANAHEFGMGEEGDVIAAFPIEEVMNLIKVLDEIVAQMFCMIMVGVDSNGLMGGDLGGVISIDLGGVSTGGFKFLEVFGFETNVELRQVAPGAVEGETLDK